MRTTKGLLSALVLGGAFLFGGTPLCLSPAVAAAAQGAQDGADQERIGKKVTLIFHDGRTVEGTLLAETATSVKVLVEMMGMSAPAEYERTELLSIEVTGDGAAPESEEAEDSDPLDSKKPETEAAKPGAATVYYFELTGSLGREMSTSPLRDIVKDIKKHQPDYVVIKVDMDLTFQNSEIPDWATLFVPLVEQFHTLNQMVPVLTDDINLDRSWKKKPKIVFWVRRAMGGVAFLPFISDTIFYTSDARQGGVGGLDRIFEGVGDEVVRQKQRSLRQGRIEGLGNRGGYDPRLMKAMTWTDYTLSYSLVGGEPVFYESTEGDHVLTDDGQGDRADAMEDIVRGRGNDVLTLNAELALAIGVSDGTADSITEVMNHLNIARNYTMVDHRAKRILEDWSDGVTRGEQDFRRLLRNFINVQVGGDFQERTAARGQQISLLRQMKSILDRYGESINPYKIGQLPDNWNMNIEIMIQQIRNRQLADGPP